MIVIEMNPRVSRVGAGVEAELHRKSPRSWPWLRSTVRSDITRETPASFEPTIDYVV
jgi:carbamoylphosphate synthase large subunit